VAVRAIFVSEISGLIFWSPVLRFAGNFPVLREFPGYELNQNQEREMKAQSKSQQRAAGAALSAKRGDTKPSDLQGASKEMYETMTKAELEEMASTSHDDLPDQKTD
jgi:Protein of unknwon function (DUF3008)